jgi:WD40 repeat protein
MNTDDKLVASNPFPGLRAFATSEADRFFGRKQQIEELAARLDGVSFLAVAGSSGCGKSSLVLAGLLSKLSRGTASGSQTVWRAVVMRPGNQPMANLAEQLSSTIGRGSNDDRCAGPLYGRLRLGGLGLVDAVRLARLDSHTRMLVMVDQFEEIFRFKRVSDVDEASAFVKLLLNAARDPKSPVTVVITLRSDSLGDCADFRDLPETINCGQYLVPKLTREQRKEAIVGPIELRGFHITLRLVQRLLNDVSDDFDDLPVMQHALARTWNRWARASQGSRPIDLEDYEAVGTAKHALSRHADEAFESLSGLAVVVEKVFRALTERVAEGTEVRRPLGFDLLCQVVGADREQVELVVERFRRPDTAFLRPGLEVPLASNPVIDISHESLIRLWQRLCEWAKVEAESRAMLDRLVDAARRLKTTPPQGSLWHGRDLGNALYWQQRTNPTPAWVGLYVKGDSDAALKSAEGFLDLSDAEERRDQLRRKLLIGGVCFLILAAVALWVTATSSRFKMAKSRTLASESLLSIEQDPARSAHLALAAVNLDSANETGVYALQQSLATLEVAHAEKIIPLDAPVSDVTYTKDGSFLVTASGKTVTIFDSKNFERVYDPITRKEDVLRAWLIDNKKMLVTQTEDGEVQIERVSGSAVRPITCEGRENPVYKVSVSPDDRHIALGCYNGAVLVWDATDLAAGPKHSYSHKVEEDVTVTALAFSFDGKYLASGDALGAVNLWKLGFPTPWIGQGGSGAKKSPIKHELYNAIRDIGFSRDDPSLLVTASEDHKAIVWRLDLERRPHERNKKNEPQSWPLNHDRPVIAVKFTAPRRDGPIPVITVSGKNTQLWENATADPKQVRAHDDWVSDANASTNGEWLVTASSDGTARIWSTRSGTPIAVLRGHRGEVSRVVFSPDGTQVVTASADGSVRVWQFRAPRLLAASNHWKLSAAFDPNGTRVAVGEERSAFVLELNGGAGSMTPVRHDLPGVETDQVTFMSWSRDGKFLVGVQNTSSSLNAVLKPILWDIERHLDITPTWFKELLTATFSPGTDELLTVSEKGQIAVWETKSLEAVETPQPKLKLGEERGRWMAAMSPDGRWIAALNAVKSNKVELWRRDDPQAGPRKLEGHKGDIKSLQFSRDSKSLLTASADRTALIWPVDRPGPPKELKGGHTASMAWASFNTNGTRVVTGSADNTIRVWDVETAKQLASLRWHSEGVNSVEFSPDGKWILSASDDGTVKLDQCEVCSLTDKELPERVAQLAKLPKTELEEIQRDSAAVIRHYLLPAFLSRGR